MVLTACYLLSLMQDIFLQGFIYFTKIFKEVSHYCKIGTFFSLDGYVEKYVKLSRANI